jgi:hypothetical protein
MPQASNDLRAKFPGSDTEALGAIEANFAISKGGWITPRAGYSWKASTQRERDAIDYLFHEWDYAYDDIAIQ